MARPSATPALRGWAAIVIHGTKRQEIAGSVPWSTVSEMELRAAVEALRLTPTGARIELRSDSELLIDGMRFLVFRWQRFGWRNSRGFELQHQELWRELLLLNERIEQFAGDGSEGTTAIPSSPAPMHLPTKLRAPNSAACLWLHDSAPPRVLTPCADTNPLENTNDRWQHTL